ncbi:MAG: hypothetical protein WC626_12460 [Methanoregula sp.]
MKYLNEFIFSFFFSIILSITVIYFTNNIVAGIGIFTALLVSSQFLLNRYENRIDVQIDAKIKKQDTNFQLSISIINKGGKTIYLKSGGIITNDSLIFDFDDKKRESKKITQTNDVVEKKPKQKEPWAINIPELIPIDFSTTFVMPLFPFTLNPGQSMTISRDFADILEFLKEKDRQGSNLLEFKGFFRDQLNREYISESVYNFKELFDLAKIG